MAGIVWTQTDIDNIQAAIRIAIARGASEVIINGREVKYLSLAQLRSLLAEAESNLNAQTYGGAIPVKFVEVE